MNRMRTIIVILLCCITLENAVAENQIEWKYELDAVGSAIITGLETQLANDQLNVPEQVDGHDVLMRRKRNIFL